MNGNMFDDMQLSPAERVLETLLRTGYRPGQSIGALVPSGGRAIVGPRASLAHRFCAALLSDVRICGEFRVTAKDERLRPAESEALRDDAVERLLSAEVEEPVIAALFSPDALWSLLESREVFRRLVYWNTILDCPARFFFAAAAEDGSGEDGSAEDGSGEDGPGENPPGEPASGAPEGKLTSLNRSTVVLDGSNIAWNGAVRERGGVPRVSNLVAVCSALQQEYGVRDLRVFFDANIADEAPDAAEQLEILGSLTPGVGTSSPDLSGTRTSGARSHSTPDPRPSVSVLHMPPGTPADAALLGEAQELGCLIISNDQFRDYRKGSAVNDSAPHSKRGRRTVLKRRIAVRVTEGTPRFDHRVEELNR